MARPRADSPRAWAVALGAAIANGVAFGTLYTFGAFVKEMADEFDTGLGPTAIVFGITMFLFFGTGAAVGKWADRYGPRPLLLIGAVMFCGGLWATSQVSALWQGYLVYGIGAGLGGGLFSAPLFAALAAWFVKHRAFAQGVGATGPGLGTLLLVPYAKDLIEADGWRSAYQTLAVIAAISFAVAMVLVAKPPAAPAGDGRSHLRAVIRTGSFKRLAVAGTLMSTALIGAFAFIIPFAEADGFSSAEAARLVSIVGASSILGRLALTSLAGTVGSVRLLQWSFAAQPIAYAFWLFAGGRYALLVVFATFLGISYGGFVALMGDVTAHLFGLVAIGRVLGALYLASGVGSLIGPPLAGFLSDAVDGRGLPLSVILVVATLGVVVLSRLSPEPVRFGDPDPRSTALRKAEGSRPVPIPLADGSSQHPSSLEPPPAPAMVPAINGNGVARHGTNGNRVATIPLLAHSGRTAALDRPEARREPIIDLREPSADEGTVPVIPLAAEPPASPTGASTRT